MRVVAPNFTQMPNELIDDWLPKLSHVQLKVLMVIIRKTFGWHKIKDRISLSQLEAITGSDRSKIIKATKYLENIGLITKEVLGKKGEQQTFYELVVIEDSKNCYQCPNDTPPSGQTPPTKETLTKYKEKNSKKRNAEDKSPKITFNKATRKFEGIKQEDIDQWRKAHPSINVLKVIDEAAIWALANEREHYRVSLNTFMKNQEKNHTTPYKPEEKKSEFTHEDVLRNKKISEDLEIEYNKNKIQNYDIQAKPSNLLFLFPNNYSECITYECTTEEFKKKCQLPLQKMKLKM